MSGHTVNPFRRVADTDKSLTVIGTVLTTEFHEGTVRSLRDLRDNSTLQIEERRKDD